jgi:hypothetical protein
VDVIVDVGMLQEVNELDDEGPASL